MISDRMIPNSIHAYYCLIGSCYYEDNKPIGKIMDMEEYTNRQFKLYLNPVYYNQFKTPAYVIVDQKELDVMLDEKDIRTERKEILKSRNIENLYHFTPIENLESILEYGLLSNNLLDAYGMDYYGCDPYRMDGKLDRICTSIEFPNYKMLYSKRMEDPNQKYALIKLDKHLILHKLDTEFYPSNAANSIFRNDNIDHKTNEALESMFYERLSRRSIPDRYPTDPQAEVLVKNEIMPVYIEKIITENNSDEVYSIVRNSNRDIDYGFQKTLFMPRRDYERWQ